MDCPTPIKPPTIPRRLPNAAKTLSDVPSKKSKADTIIEYLLTVMFVASRAMPIGFFCLGQLLPLIHCRLQGRS